MINEWIDSLTEAELKEVAVKCLAFTKTTVSEYPIDYIRFRVTQRIKDWPTEALQRIGYQPEKTD